MEVRRRVRVEGRVQGVGFRWFARSAAHDLGVVGWVRNEPDGSVLCEAQAAPAMLEEFLARLGKGPGFARVDLVQTEAIDAVPDDTGFEVTH